MSDGNFKIRCIESFSNEFHVGKEYDVIEGNIYHNGGISVLQYSSVEQINQQFCSQFELVEEGGKNMSKWNGKIRCIDNNNVRWYTTGKIYEVKDGVFFDDEYDKEEIESFEAWSAGRGSKWEEVKEDLRELLKPCMMVKCRDGILRMVVQCEDGLIIKRFNGNDWILISDYNDDLTLVKRVNEHLDIIEIYGYEKFHGKSLQPSINSRELLWKREEKSPQQIEIEEIEAEQRKLADRLAKLRKEM